MADKIEMYKLLNEQKERYVYHLIALSTSSIGFVVFITIDKTFNYSLLLIGIATGCWLYSIFFGLRYLKLLMLNVSANLAYIDIEEGNVHLHDLKPEYQKAGIEGTMKAMKINSAKLNKYYKRLNQSFYFAIIVFLCWHLLEMTIRSIY